jgi:hypothetical protein
MRDDDGLTADFPVNARQLVDRGRLGQSGFDEPVDLRVVGVVFLQVFNIAGQMRHKKEPREACAFKGERAALAPCVFTEALRHHSFFAFHLAPAGATVRPFAIFRKG